MTHFITCGKGDIGPSYERGSWIAEIESDTIAMNWFDSVLLFLQRTEIGLEGNDPLGLPKRCVRQ